VRWGSFKFGGHSGDGRDGVVLLMPFEGRTSCRALFIAGDPLKKTTLI